MSGPRRGRRRAGLSVVLLAALTAALGAAPSAVAEPALPAGFQDSIAIGNLEQPTNFRFAPDGRVFVAEKPGEILVYENLEDTTPEVFADLRTDVYDTGDRGLLGLALDPKFDEGKPYVYALYTYDHILGDPNPPPRWGSPETTGDPCPELDGGDACVVSGRLVRLTAEENHAAEFGGAPLQDVLAEGWCQQFSSHSIGDLAFGPEGDLYASGGDGASFTSADYGQLGEPTANPCGDPPGGVGTALSPPTAEGGSLRAQNLDVLSGKILRVDPETGQGLASNPLGGSSDENTRRIVAEGFRNPFRFTFDPQTHELYTGNVGSSEIEEIDRFPTPPTSIYNSGWPCYEGPERQFQFKVLGLEVCERLYGEEEAGEASTSEPFFYYSHGQSVVPNDECPISSGSAIGGLSFYDGEKFPAKYKGALFFADAVRGCIWVMYPGEDGRPDPVTTERFMREGKIYPGVDIEKGPEGDLYYADLFGNEEYGAGAIHRISYEPGAPTARLSANPPYGTSWPLEVTFEAGESSDPTGETLEYDWDLNGDSTFETHGEATRVLTFARAELEEAEAHGGDPNKVVAVKVTDGEGLSSVARVTVYPGDSPPQPEIEKPAASLKWSVGDEIELEGLAQDSEGNPIYTPLSYYWSTRLLHCPTGPSNCHAHPLQTFAGTRSGTFLAPEHDYPSYIEVTLRVADERGLTGSKTVKIEPRPVELTLESSPPGVELTAGLVQGSAPLSMTAVEGDHVLLSAPETAEVNGKTYAFHAWSDGSARIHTVEAKVPTTYTAEYEAPEAQLALAATPQSWNGEGKLEVEFDASGSNGEGPLEYEWDTGTGFETGSATKTIPVEAAGEPTVEVRVKDSHGATDVAEQTLHVVALELASEPTGLPLKAAMVEKAAPFTLLALQGSNVELSASPNEELGGIGYVFSSWSDQGARTHDVPASSETYTAHYVEYTAPQAALASTEAWNAEGRLEAHFDASSSTGAELEYEWDTGAGFEPGLATKAVGIEDEAEHVVKVLVRDSHGATAEAEVTVQAVELQIHSEPAGVPLRAGTVERAAPFGIFALRDSSIELSAPQQAAIGAASYGFSSWSDGGTRTHSLQASLPGTYAAAYTETPPVEEPHSGPVVQPPLLPLIAELGATPPKATHLGTARFTFSAANLGAQFHCKLDHESFRRCHSPQVYKHLRPGKHMFRLFSTYRGARSARLTYRWKVLLHRRVHHGHRRR